MNPDRVKAILADTDFVACVEATRAALTKKVMAKAATPEDRDKALAEYHALATLIAQMRSAGQNTKENPDE